MNSLSKQFELALQYHQAGNLHEAELRYRQILQIDPRHADALHMLGLIAHQVGKSDVAVDYIQQALRLHPRFPAAYNNLGLALMTLGKTTEALASYRQALALQPDFAEAYINLGIALKDQGELGEAIASYRHALVLKPDNAQTHYNLGNALKLQGKLEDAIANYQQAVRLNPQNAEAYNNLGIALKDQGKLEEAIASYRQALRLKPDVAEMYNNLGIALKDQGQLDEAIISFRQALRLKPDVAEVYNNLGIALNDQGDLEGAIASYRQALLLQPENAGAFNNLGVALKGQGKLEEAIASYRQALHLKPDLADAYALLGNALKEQGKLDEAMATYRAGLASKPDGVVQHSNFVYGLNFHPDYDRAAILAECRKWELAHAQPLMKFTQPHANDRSADRRLRIGYVSPDFRSHAESFFTIPLLSNHDHRQAEIFCYADVVQPDAITQRLRGYADVWRSTVGLSDQEVADLIRSDKIDILVDLTMHMANNRLLVFARKPAPVQVTWLAYPGTTGLATMDYRLTDPYLDPPGLFDACYAENSIRLPHTFACYDPLTDESEVNPLPALANGFVTFGCLNNFSKINDAVLMLWARALRAVPRSRLMLLAPRGQARDHVLSMLRQERIDDGRVEFVDRQPRQQYLQRHHRIDVNLDPLPYNGITTSLDGFWMGVPTLTLMGKTAAGRAGWSQLCNLGLPEFAARTPDEFVEIAAKLAGDLSRLQDLRQTLRSRLVRSPLMDGPLFARNMEGAFRQMWHNWCRQAVPKDAEAYNNLGMALRDMGKLDEAIAKYQQALRLRPDVAAIHNNLGIALKDQGKIEEAIASYRQALRLKPDAAEVCNNLGLALNDQGKLEEAIASYRQALRLQPENTGAYNNLGVALKGQGMLEEAIASYRQVLRLKPDFAEAHLNLGNALIDQGKQDEAINCYEQALRLKPDYAVAYYNLGNALKDQRKLDEAVACYQQALRLKPDDAGLVFNNLGNALKEQGKLDEAIASYQQALRLKPFDVGAHDNLLMVLHYHLRYDSAALYQEARRWNDRHAEPLARYRQPHANPADPDRRLRIGYVSPDFRVHAGSHFTMPLLSNHDRRQVEIFCYAEVARPDYMTERLRGCADGWRSTVGLTNEQMADLVRHDRIDILVDLALHTAKNRLLVFARKPAPVQVTWLGYPGTTGLSTIDYRLTDPYLDPPGENNSCYSEQSIRLPDTFWCYDPLTDQPMVHDLPALANGFITFGCLNNFDKVNDEVLMLWAKVLGTVPRSRLSLLAPRGPARDRVLAILRQEGIDERRVEFTDRQPRQQYLQLYNRIDLGLDLLPVNGHTTSLDAFWMGVPTITLIGTTVVGRAGFSQLCNLGLRELAARTPQEFVEIAANLAGDLSRLQDLRQSLRPRMVRSPLMDAPRFAGNMERAFRQMWHNWCRQAVPKDAEACNNLGMALRDMGKLDEAVSSYQQALQLKPDVAAVHNNLGIALKDQGKLEDAIASYQQALRLKPDVAEVYNNLGIALNDQGKFEEALASFEQALRLQPENAGTYNNLGSALKNEGKLDEAIANHRHALRLQPAYADAHNNLGVALRLQGQLEEAIKSYQQALRLQPDHADAHNNLAMLLLLMGDFSRGWQEFEWRRQTKQLKSDFGRFSQPFWQGEPLPHGTILLHAEAGLGDTIQFIRFAALVKERVGTVLCECPLSLARLLRSCAGIDSIIPFGSPLPAFDVHAPLMSLPRILGTTLETIPARIPYLYAEPALVNCGLRIADCGLKDAGPAFESAIRNPQSAIVRDPQFNIGVVWQGNSTGFADGFKGAYRERSIPLTHFESLARVPGVRLISLQKGFGTQQLDEIKGRFSIDVLGSTCDDFNGTAAVMRNLDLVISVDTSTAHLAGALGVPVWVPLPSACCWRWLTHREDSPWYPTMRLFRQTSPGEWSDVFERMARELACASAPVDNIS